MSDSTEAAVVGIAGCCVVLLTLAFLWFVQPLILWLIWTHYGLGAAIFPAAQAILIRPGYWLCFGFVVAMRTIFSFFK